jgi:transcriptional regulator GlxA family with amidase domain
MYDKDSISSQQAGTMPHGSAATPTIDDETTEVTWVSLDRLRSAVVELSTALNESLHDERSSAAACLQRAKAILQGRDHASPRPANSDRPRGLAPWQVRKVITHIEMNLDMSIRNKDLAALARLSEFHFNVAFRNSVGEPPHEYLIRRRVERAQGLMLSTQRALSDIAVECGMADQAHMTRLSRRIVGDSPAAWRRARINPGA